MKKLFPYILIVFIVVQMLMPFTVGVGVKNNLEVRNNKAEAVDTVYYYFLSTKNVEPDIGTQAWSNSFADVVDASGNITTSGKDLCEAAKTPEVMAALVKAGYSAGPCTIVPKEQLGPGGSVTPPKDTSDLPVCMEGIVPQIGGCIAQGMYYLFFKPTSFVFGLSGKALDFTLKYSLDDTSYRSSFVVEGWGLVRDFCNMFFIFILLYIAFGTILNLHSVKTKEMIINVVIIGLLINFSLFATQVIIDTSNILARVFYNQNTIVTGTVQKDALGNPLPIQSQLGDFGEIQLSTAIVSKVNPVLLITNAQEVNTIQTASIQGEDQTTTNKGITTSSFIIVVILATFVNVVGTIAFISCALVFIGRVLMLWLAMILAPLAFFSYTVPALQNIKMIGWKQWWPDTLKMAFVAPVFAFFMYIIVGFLGKGLDVINASLTKGYHGLSFVIAMIVPFAFIMILLMKAKSIAVSMSGEVGSALSKVGATVGGLGLAAVTGGAAMAMRGTVGRAGSAIANSDRVKKWEKEGKWGATTLRNIGTSAGKGSFDARATKLGEAAGKGMGVDMGKAKEGGFEKMKTDKIDKRVKRAKELEKGEGSEEKREASSLEAQIRTSKAGKATDLARVEREITELRQKMQDQKTAGLEVEAAVTYGQLEGKQDDKKILRGAEVKNAAGVVIVPKVAGGIADLEAQLNNLNDKINASEIVSMNQYAANMESMGNKTINYLKTFGQHSGVGANIAADRIRKGVKIEDKTK